MFIETSDLPPGWRVDPANPEEISAVEDALRGSQQEASIRDNSMWVRARNDDTGDCAWLRATSDENREIVISGVIFLPPAAGMRVNNRTLRALPLAGIEAEASNRRLRQLLLAAYTHHSDDDWTPTEPVGSPRESPHFYERVARQFMTIKESGEERPVARMVEINQRPAKTVQGWVTEARRRGLLPAGRQGKAG